MGMADATDIPGGVVHELPDDLRETLVAAPDALATWRDITPPGPQRMDLLDRVRQEGGHPAQTAGLGPGELDRRQAPPLLLARLPSPLGDHAGSTTASFAGSVRIM